MNEWMNKMNEIIEMNEMNEMNEINEMNEMNETTTAPAKNYPVYLWFSKTFSDWLSRSSCTGKYHQGRGNTLLCEQM